VTKPPPGDAAGDSGSPAKAKCKKPKGGKRAAKPKKGCKKRGKKRK
jgi:hypothetical protein